MSQHHQGSRAHNRAAGFSLVELMIVVGIIGILATLAMPKMQHLQAKARMAEAKTMLGHIYSLEEAYHAARGTYTNMPSYGSVKAGGQCNPVYGTELGLTITPCNGEIPRYAYRVQGASTTTFLAIASTGADADNQVCPGSRLHRFAIDQARQLIGTGPNRTPPTGCD